MNFSSVVYSVSRCVNGVCVVGESCDCAIAAVGALMVVENRE